MAIQGFRSKALQRFSEKQDARKLPAQHIEQIADILNVLEMPEPLPLLQRERKYRLHRLTGDRRGVLSVRVSVRWRITFRYDERGAYDIDLTQHYGD